DPLPGAYGVAIDVGTTTIVCHLHELTTGKRLASASRANPQVVFGGDVISRITASIEGKLDDMREILLSTLNELFDELVAEEKIERSSVQRVALAGNTVMQHIAAGLAPDTIGYAPFTTLSLFGNEVDIEPISPNAYFVPAISGYVGGDITAGLLSGGLYAAPRVLGFIDIGTNGEMAVGCADKILCCATAAGPAFEGAGIEFGMPAAAGGISKVAYEDGNLKIETIADSLPIGICGSGLIDALACMLRMGVVDSTGFLLGSEDVPEEVSRFVGNEAGANVFYLTDDRSVYITQKDIRNLQLAKAAIYAGLITLIDEYGVALEDLDGIQIAGGFGSHIDPESAARIGLIPPELLDSSVAIGNAAGEGASAALISKAAREELAEIAEKCTYIELSLHRGFNTYYIDAMSFEGAFDA
ncbi:MAG: ATP-binding protein, partial [Actinobacteria bacterium]|nr:ATP-binding protein [Actinomycetota bacterium]